MQTNRLFASGLLFLVAGCAPIPPMALFETTDVVNKHQVALTAAGGVGGTREQMNWGGTARARLGVGAHQEIGIEGSYLSNGDRDPSYGGKLSWKVAHNDSVALVLGGGASFQGDRTSVLGDVAFLVSPEVFPSRYVRFYTGFRFGLAVPTRGVYEDSGITGTLVLPMGFNFKLGRSVHLFAEGGLINRWSEVDAHVPDSDILVIRRGTTGYGGMGLSITFGK